MKLIKSIIILLVLTYSFWILEFEVFASDSIWISDLESQITPDSSEDKIIKLQKLFSGLWLYKWSIDWNYKSIEKTLIDYQLNAWLVENPWDWGAWYFGKKTIIQLQKDFPNDFEKLASEHILLEKPGLWDRNFIVTAYYSPLPWQNKYLKWSYAADIRLNWWWKVTASWKWVFAWLLAAPKNYDFWTKIELEWIWIWVVEDRWWAIVNAWERGHSYDRIDIWMWYWDEWLERAIKWWKREVKWKIVTSDTMIWVEFDVSPVTKYNNLTVDAEDPKEENVVKLQELMTEVWLYDWNIDWNFEEVKDELVDFQVKYKIIDSENSKEAWYFWDKTLAILRKNYWWWIFKIPTNIVYLSLQKKRELEKIKRLLLEYIDKKSYWNKLLEYKFKQSLKNNLDVYIAKISSKTKKQELRFLKDIL